MTLKKLSTISCWFNL